MELGKKLLIRGTKGSRKVTLNKDVRLLRTRAEEILSLVEKTERMPAAALPVPPKPCRNGVRISTIIYFGLVFGESRWIPSWRLFCNLC